METDIIIEKLKVEYEQLTDEIKQALDSWINSLSRQKTYNYSHTSYGLKHYFEKVGSNLGKSYYVTNDQFKYAMYKNDFEPDDYNALNWCFKLSNKQEFSW